MASITRTFTKTLTAIDAIVDGTTNLALAYQAGTAACLAKVEALAKQEAMIDAANAAVFEAKLEALKAQGKHATREQLGEIEL